MAGAAFGKLFTVTTWGEPQGGGIGVIIDGVPRGVKINENDVQSYLNRRKPVAAPFEAGRHENDFVSINSGVRDGLTDGMPISMTITNSALRAGASAAPEDIFRPGLSDMAITAKYGPGLPRGGIGAAWRESAARVAAGAVAVAFLKQLGIEFISYVKSIGPHRIVYSNCSTDRVLNSVLKMPDADAEAKALAFLEELKKKGDTAGGIVEVIISGVPAGVGEPVFDKLDARLAGGIMSIGMVNGIEFGEGFDGLKLTGSEITDGLVGRQGQIEKATNNSGGLTGGLSDGDEIILRASIQPLPAPGKEKEAVKADGTRSAYESSEIIDTTIAPRAVVVVEAMSALVLADLMLENMLSRMDRIEAFYRK
ncbi:MAG: chorismate synthase [Lachnospiraceae bacterium]|nr:chorismate synthase [Lachnospiraceae bacterium]